AVASDQRVDVANHDDRAHGATLSSLGSVFGGLAVAKSRTGLGRDVASIDLQAAVLAGQPRVRNLATRVVAQDDRWTARAGEVSVTPAHEGDDGGEEVASSVRQSVLMAVGIAGVRDALEQ